MHRGSYALITGASRGIGLALAREFASQGHNLVLVARDLDRLENLAIALKTHHAVDVQACAADLTEDESPGRIVEFCTRRGLRIDTLVNNAGMLSAGEMADMAAQDLHALVNLNIRAAAELSLAFASDMRERGAGCIVNISSLAGAGTVAGAGLYSASKAFLTSFTDSLRAELDGTGVHCHTVMLGPVKTDMLAETGWLHRLAASPDAVAEVIYDGMLARRKKFSAGLLGASLMLASNVLPTRVLGRLVTLR